ncbi:HAD-IIB family hydrolase [Balneolaceae bacterium ANBcel3]|nr:HAD-IIB family hydrolase [Balneolaceae bacterium ANBcel3]
MPKNVTAKEGEKSQKSDGKKDLHLQLFSLHGLIRGQNLELGRDADTGGQTKYVVELAKALGEHPRVKQVDLFTRLIDDKRVSSDYKQPIEPLGENSRIVRIRCGGKRYMRKELLWPSLSEFVDNVIRFNKKEKITPDLLHGHYADAGYVARQVSKLMGIPYVFTGHSLGQSKKNSLSNKGLTLKQMKEKFNIEERIIAEEDVLRTAAHVVVSTNHEIDKQYSLYKNFDKASYTVIPPGIDVDTFYPYYYDHDENWHKPEPFIQAREKMDRELARFFYNKDKPLILTICRPDSRKNIQGLITAFGENKELQAIANLAVFAGIRKEIDQLDDNEKEVLTEMLLLMDKYDLYGKFALPKKHDPTTEVPELFRMAADRQGVFVNSAFSEPFGITLIEAASTGVPIVGPDDGGPQDIVKNCQNGQLVDTSDAKALGETIKSILIDQETWREYSNNGVNGVRKHYSWEAHAHSFLESVDDVIGDYTKSTKKHGVSQAPGWRFAGLDKMLITDIDDTLVGDDEALEQFITIMEKNRKEVGFGVATGRSLELVEEILAEKNIPVPDVIISSVGTEIYYGPDLKNLSHDSGWRSHISYQWKPSKIKEVLKDFDFLVLQDRDGERDFKISYNMDPNEDHIAMIHQRLSDYNLRYQLIYSHGAYLDIVPSRASKGKAIQYLGKKWDIAPHNTLVSGDSGNDYEMLYGQRLAVVVGNHAPEIEKLRGNRRVYFADSNYAAGIIEGIQHYKFMDTQSE